MGRNKDLRKRISGHEAVLGKHEAKIRAEAMKDHPDEDKIEAWRREIHVWQDTVARLKRRLQRSW